MGAFFQFSALEGNDHLFLPKQLGWWQKYGAHTFALDTRWNEKEDKEKNKVNSRWGFSSATFYGGTKLNDDWKVAMTIRPELDCYGFKQKSKVSLGLSGRLSDEVKINAVFDDKKTARVTGTYQPSKNVDFSMTNLFKMGDPLFSQHLRPYQWC